MINEQLGWVIPAVTTIVGFLFLAIIKPALSSIKDSLVSFFETVGKGDKVCGYTCPTALEINKLKKQISENRERINAQEGLLNMLEKEQTQMKREMLNKLNTEEFNRRWDEVVHNMHETQNQIKTIAQQTAKIDFMYEVLLDFSKK